jgi:hypothetical protein
MIAEVHNGISLCILILRSNWTHPSRLKDDNQQQKNDDQANDSYDTR